DQYLASYANADRKTRARQITEVWAEDAELIDPPMTGVGHEGIGSLAETLVGQFPGHTFRRTTGIDAHHGFARYAWELVAPDGQVAVAGMDVAEVDDHGRLRRVVGFFGALAAAA